MALNGGGSGTFPGETISDDLSLPEAPVPLADGSWLVAEMGADRGTVARVSADGVRVPLARTGRPNGLAVGRDGSVWVAESLVPSLIKLQLSGEFTSELQEAGGRPLLWPNDLCFGPDGALYATDSGIRVDDLLVEGQPIEGAQDAATAGTVFRYDPQTGGTTVIDDGLAFANGIAFGPDGLLYANETQTGDIWRYRIRDGRRAGEAELFANVSAPGVRGPGLHGPDGMAFSADGRLWVAIYGGGEIMVLDRFGRPERRIPVEGQFPTNVAFGLDGQTKLYVVEDEHGSLTSLDVGAVGLALYD